MLFVGAGQSFSAGGGPDSGPDGDGGWQAVPWEPEHTYRTLPATHFSLIEAQADAAAELIEDWIRSLGC